MMNSERSKRVLTLAFFAWAIVAIGVTLHNPRGGWVIGVPLCVPLVALIWLASRMRDPVLSEGLRCVVWGTIAAGCLLEGDYFSFFGWGFIGLWCAYDWLRATDRATIAVSCVRAPGLAGVVEYGKLHFSGVRVEECSKDWMDRLAQVETDDEGRFALPEVSDGAVRYLRVSYQGAKTAYLQLELSPKARPLVVHLESRAR